MDVSAFWCTYGGVCAIRSVYAACSRVSASWWRKTDANALEWPEPLGTDGYSIYRPTHDEWLFCTLSVLRRVTAERHLRLVDSVIVGVNAITCNRSTLWMQLNLETLNFCVICQLFKGNPLVIPYVCVGLARGTPSADKYNNRSRRYLLSYRIIGVGLYRRELLWVDILKGRDINVRLHHITYIFLTRLQKTIFDNGTVSRYTTIALMPPALF